MVNQISSTGNVNKPLLSVIIPVYNSERWLPDCIYSLVNQTMQNIEYIFVDDNSTDNSLHILRDACQRYNNKIRLIIHESNRRQGGARNTGIMAANADYIGFCDSDDFVAPDMYEKLFNRIKETNSDIVYGQDTRIPENISYESACQRTDFRPDIKWNPNLLKLDNKNLDEHDKCDIIAYEKGRVYTLIIRKRIILDNDIWFPEDIRYEDNYWNSLVMPYINKISFVQSIGYYYRQHSTSTCNELGGRQYFERIKIEKGLLKEVKRRNLFEQYYPAWEYTYAYRYAVNTTSLLINRFEKPSYHTIYMIRRDLDKEFPRWRRNRYWKERQNFIGRLKSYIKIYCPKCFGRFKKILHIIQKP